MTDSSRMANQRSSDCEWLMSTSLLLAHWHDMWFLDFLGFDMKCFVTCSEHTMSVKNRWLFMPCESQFTMANQQVHYCGAWAPRSDTRQERPGSQDWHRERR
jgi:hypothetical protein